jgi:SAM-dependent methyltransferase
LEETKEYWDKRFKDEGKIWGELPSRTAQYALELFRRANLNSVLIPASVLDMSFDTIRYDAIYCFNVLHLFHENERTIFIRECENKLKEDGLMFFTVFSEKESSFGEGTEVEKNTFESRPGRPAHYFTEEDFKAHFAKYGMVDMGMMEDPEDHGGKPHTHILRYICVRVY